MRGKVINKFQSGFIHQDHPRLCGEKFTLLLLSWKSKGSPPPMRGKEEAAPKLESDRRITPAYAGKRGKGWQAGNSTQDHPRLCGEKLLIFSR